MPPSLGKIVLTGRRPNLTVLRPSVSQHDSISAEFGFIQNTLPQNPFEPSALEGLNLNVYVPEGTDRSSRLPVLVWIHGGGYIQGSITWPQWDLTRLVQLSKENGMPVVAVAMKYVIEVVPHDVG